MAAAQRLLMLLKHAAALARSRHRKRIVVRLCFSSNLEPPARTGSRMVGKALQCYKYCVVLYASLQLLLVCSAAAQCYNTIIMDRPWSIN